MLLTAFLAVSGSAWALSQIDGVYQIGTAEDLKAFAELVNDGDVRAKAVLTADIDYTTDAVQIGNPTFKGVFDGQGHTVTIAFEGTDTEGVNAALFYKMAGIVKNLRVSGTVTSPKKFAASIAYFLYGWIDHCYSDVTITSTFSGQSCCGGIAGQCFNGGLFSNCYFAGKFTSETATRFSGIMGWSNGQNSVVNSLVYATCEGKACTNDGWKIAGDCSRVDNNYSLYNAEAKLQNQNKKAGRYIIGCFDTNTDELASGEIAYKLNWGQEIGVDPTPDPMSTHTVYPLGSCKEPTGYTNDAAQSAHSYSGYKCTVCGAYNPDFMTPVNGYYEIGTPEQLAWFSLYVHEKHCDANARLTADIDLSSFPNFGMIGTSGADTCYFSMYRGTFDGQYHKISNLKINMPSVASVGLFASVAAPAKIKNLYLDETCTISGNNQVGGIAGHVIGNVDGDEVTLLGLGSAASVSSKSGVSDAGVGGIVGKAYGVTCDIMNCWFQGTLSGTSLGFISGWCGNKPRVTSCWSTCSSEGVTALVRCASLVMQNCFATQGTQVTRITAEDVASGALCYGLNKGILHPSWYQTIGEDAIPVLDTWHGRVNKISDTGYATQYNPHIDLTIPAGVKAYVGKVDGDVLKLTEVTEKIPAATAVVLKGAEGYYSFMPTTGAAAVAENDLKGAATNLTADGSQYVLAKKDDVVGFYQTTEGTIEAYKAYLTGIAAGVKVVTFGTATSLTPALSEEREAVIYDLSGRRVEKATKGIYIINGKKVLK